MSKVTDLLLKFNKMLPVEKQELAKNIRDIALTTAIAIKNLKGYSSIREFDDNEKLLIKVIAINSLFLFGEDSDEFEFIVKVIDTIFDYTFDWKTNFEELEKLYKHIVKIMNMEVKDLPSDVFALFTNYQLLISMNLHCGIEKYLDELDSIINN